jgi:hypothetical protein
MQKLHNDHNVYILGAGFSAERGLPIVKNFMFEMRDAYDWLKSAERLEEAKAIENVLDFRHDAAASAYRVKVDLENIEELFSLASASTGFAKSKDLSKFIRIAIAATLDFCTSKTTEKQFGIQNQEALPFYEQYRNHDQPNSIEYRNIPAYQFYIRSMLGMQDTIQGENTFISFNYDTVVEEALSSMNVGFSYGFKAKTVNYKTNILNLSNQNIKLLKLHGSVNWARVEQAKKGAGKLAVYDSYDATRAANAIPELIPPTWRKVFDGNLEGVWNDAIDAIKIATRIVIVGFSVPETDNHFKYLLAAGLQSNISLRDIVFVNPDGSQEFKERISNLFTTPQSSRVSFESSMTEQYMKPYPLSKINRGFPASNIFRTN